MSTVVYPNLQPAALSSMVGIARSAIAHEHAGSGGSLEDIVNTFDPKRTAFLVVPGADIVSNTFGLRSCHVIQVIWVVLWRPEVRFASDEDDRNDRSADGPDLFDPL